MKLTDQQIEDVFQSNASDDPEMHIRFARAIIAAHEAAMTAPEGWKLVPIEPTTTMISAMSCSQARDDEGQYPALVDLLDFSGEDKTHTALKAAYSAMIEAAPDHGAGKAIQS